jgi:hypothetical protein
MERKRKRRRESSYKFMIMAIQNLKPGQSVRFPLMRPKGLVDYIYRWGLKPLNVHLSMERDGLVAWRQGETIEWK